MLKYFIISDEMRTFLQFAILFFVVLVYSNQKKWGKYVSDRFFRNRDLVKEAREIAAQKAPVGLLVIDEIGKVLASNEYVEEYFRWKEKDIVGDNIKVLFDEIDFVKIDGLKRLHSAANDNTTIELQALDKKNNPIPIEVSVAMEIVSGLILYIISLRDISHRKINELQVKILDEHSRQEYSMLKDGERINNCGTWIWDLTTDPDEVTLSEQAAHIFDIPYGTKVTSAMLMEVVHFEDREKVNQALSDAIENNATYEVKHRVSKRNKSLDLVHCKGESFQNENGVTIKITGVSQVIETNV